jgi:hypothetical protein
MPTKVPSYRFKYDNESLETYRDNARVRAGLLREEARVLTARAEQIEAEAANLCVCMQEVK